MKKFLQFSLFLIALSFSLSACMDETYDRPVYVAPKYSGSRTFTIKQLKALCTSSLVKVDTNAVICGVVVANDESGNIYKAIEIQDETGGIEVSLDQTSLYNTYPVGQRIYIECKGMYLGTYGGVVKLGDTYNNAIGRMSAVKISKHFYNDGLPSTTNLPAIREISSTSQLNDSMLNTLVTLKNVSFADAGKVFAEYQTTTERNINFADATSLVAYNSGYAKFQASLLPSGSGNVTGVLSKFKSTWQILIRSWSDLEGFQVIPIVGNGSKTNPYVITDAKQKQGETGKWIKGYIVGVIETVNNVNTASFTAPFTSQTNVLIAQSDTVKTLANCIPVQLPTGTIRTDLNLNGNAANLGKQIMVYGDLSSYFSQSGIKNTSAYWWVDSNTGYDPNVGAIFTESFSTNQGNFTTQSVSGTQAWAFASGYGMKMSGYSSGNIANEDWLISPSVNLSGKTTAKLSFNHAINYSTVMTNLTAWVSTDYNSGAPSTATWTQLTIPTYPAGNNWTFVGSGNIDLASVVGNSNVHIAFKYISTTSTAATWEVKDFAIKE